MNEFKKSEVVALVLATVKDYVLEKKESGRKYSPSEGVVHAGMIVRVINELTSTFTDEDESERNAQLFTAMLEIENGSALRQKLAKLPEFKFLNGDKATVIADDYC